MKKILILTIGSRGDVQPYFALGKALLSRGYTVRLATLKEFSRMASEVGLELEPLDAGINPILNTPEIKRALAGGLIRNFYGVAKVILPVLPSILDNAWAAAQGIDLIIYHPLALAGHSIAEKLEIPGIIALSTPVLSPTAAFASPDFPRSFKQGRLNRVSHELVIGGSLALFRYLINPWRKERLKLSPVNDQLSLRGKPLLKLYSYSTHILPIPPDWDETTQVTGYWFLDRGEWQPPEPLLHFLSNGPAPVYVGFGSVVADAERLTRIVLQAGQIAKQRMVLSTGWGGLVHVNGSMNVFTLDTAPHDWLFPRMEAVVHHGGAGTTAAGLRAGKPTVICPFSGDQPFWGRRVAALGAGPAIIPQKHLTAERLAEAIIEAVNNPIMHKQANELGERIRQEDGVGKAVEVIEDYVELF
jgi:UDP:flavonoid glycosyltransferase YjiC (YdhE family)